MGLFDKVRQVLARAGLRRSADDQPPGDQPSGDQPSGADHPEAAADRPEAGREQQRSPIPAEPAHSVSAVEPEAEAEPQPDPEAEPDAADAVAGVPDESRTGDEEPAEQTSHRYRTHTILPGQSLEEVAALHGVGVEQVAELNGLDPELIFAGQVVRIPHA